MMTALWFAVDVAIVLCL